MASQMEIEEHQKGAFLTKKEEKNKKTESKF